MYYLKTIKEHLDRSGYIGRYDPRHILAWMKLEYGTLDHLTRRQFDREIEMARACVDADRSGSERLAQSYGL